ncbi:hypothetical protein AgCh_008074 [Apium graveolens]
MSWFMRLKEDAKIYDPEQHPQYSDPDNFTIKLHHGVEIKTDPKLYVSGSVDYFDFCNVDELSLVDLNAMLKEAGEMGGITGCFQLDSDDELMDMCALVKSRYVDIFVTTVPPLSSSQLDLITQDFVEGSSK